MGFDDTVLICDEVDPVLNKILQDNGLKVSYEPEITPDEIKEKISSRTLLPHVLGLFISTSFNHYEL